MTRACLYTLSFSVTLQAPWLVHGTDPGRLGLDAVQLRAPDGVRRVLPGTLLAGRIREAWLALRELGLDGVPEPGFWFGQAGDQDSGPAARVHVADLVEVSNTNSGALEHRLSIAHRLQMNALAGAGYDGMLVAIEQEEAPGAEVTLEGKWHAWLTPEEVTMLPAALARGLRWHTQLGALRNIGFGTLKEVKVTAETVGASAAGGTVTTAARAFVQGDPFLPRGLRLDFGELPIAVDTRQVNGNLFVSGDQVPGAAVKAALARMLSRTLNTTALPAWFDELRITHAQPCAGSARPAPLPQSLVFGHTADNRPCLWDLALSDSPAPLDGQGRSVAFAGDWKPEAYAQASRRQCCGATMRHLRVRTAIDRIQRQAQHEKLFAYECVVAACNPPTEGTPADTRTRWQATLDLPPPHDTPAAWQALADALAGGLLGPLGKTDAYASVELLPAVPPAWPSARRPLSPGQPVRLLLASDARLCPTNALLGHTSTRPVDLLAAYRKALADIATATLPGRPGAATAMTLTRFFATQHLAGGDFLNSRFMRRQPAASYLPWVLTDAGSVFVLTVNDAPLSEALLAHWLRHGLTTGRAADWRSNPYLPQNGYGEVLVEPETGFEPWPSGPPRV